MRQADGSNLNESGQNTSTDKDGKTMTHSQQINNQQILNKRNLNLLGSIIDQTMMTEMEYLKCLQDNSMQENTMDGGSFLKGMGGFGMNVERSGSVTVELKQMQDENLALKEINEQYLSKI